MYITEVTVMLDLSLFLVCVIREKIRKNLCSLSWSGKMYCCNNVANCSIC